MTSAGEDVAGARSSACGRNSARCSSTRPLLGTPLAGSASTSFSSGSWPGGEGR